MSNSKLPVIVGFGGFNAAGRSSFHHGYHRMIMESLSEQQSNQTVADLAVLTGMVKSVGDKFEDSDGKQLSLQQVGSLYREAIEAATLVRRIEDHHFNADAVHWHKNLSLQANDGGSFTFTTLSKQLPEPLPANWHVEQLVDGNVKVEVKGGFECKVDSYRSLPVQSGGQLPTGFDPASLYNSRYHPRGLQMAVTGASDAVHSLGIDWQTVVSAVRPDEIGVYAGSVLSQLDEFSNIGLIQTRLKGGRVSSKQLAMGMSTMPGDFINAYVLGSVGTTGGAVGACATFLYTLRQGMEDIQSGRRRVVLVGASEAAISPEVLEGFNAMSALASDANLRYLDKTDHVDYRRACRPFAENCGFVVGESAQYIMLMDDALAIELGADIYGAVPNAFINADGFKKSISAPGSGNYITLAKSVASAQAILGEEAIQKRSFLQAHGSGTPQNRVTESLIFDKVAKNFGIERWPLAAVKAYVGHSIGPASADQLVATLGVYKHGILPGIKTISEVADDVYAERLGISNKDQEFEQAPEVSFLNSKGFGGNNATAAVLSPQVVEKMLAKRYGSKAFTAYQKQREGVREKAAAYDQRASKGQFDTIYGFGQNMIDESGIELSTTELKVPGFKNAVSLEAENPYQDMT